MAQYTEDELIQMFSSGPLPPAEDDIWYEVLSSGFGDRKFDLECRILKILRDRRYNAYIAGEKDSFGWVTRGIFIDDECMCIF